MTAPSMTDAEVLFLLLVGHALTDFPLQGDFLSRAKNHRAPLPGVPWRLALLTHALISSAPVWLVTRSWWMTAVEIVVHARVDWAKNEGVFDHGGQPPNGFRGERGDRQAFMVDQYIHIGSKVLYACVWAVSR